MTVYHFIGLLVSQNPVKATVWIALHYVTVTFVANAASNLLQINIVV